MVIFSENLHKLPDSLLAHCGDAIVGLVFHGNDLNQKKPIRPGEFYCCPTVFQRFFYQSLVGFK